MLFRSPSWPGLADGTITVAIRWWKRPTVRAGGTLRSPAGLLAIESVEPITLDDLDDADARAAGHVSLDDLLAELGPGGDGRRLHRVRFHPAGGDPRDALRAQDHLDQATLADLVARLDRLDGRAPTPWTRPTLRLIAERPGVVSTELAADLGMDRASFKLNVRKLKAFGLTESLDVGYRLSPRGTALRRALDPPGRLPARRSVADLG